MPHGKSWSATFGALAATAVLVAAALTAAMPTQTAAQPPLGSPFDERFEVYEDPRPAPETAFESLDGGEITLADFEGEVVVLNFWATWCAPCVHEMPTLDNLDAMMADEGVRVIAVSIDQGGMEQVEPFLRDELNLDRLGIYLDEDSALAQAFEVRGMPTTYVIDAAGNVVGGMAGPADWDSDEAVALVRHYVDAGRAAGLIETRG